MNNTNQGNSEELDFGLSFAEESQHQPLGHADIRPDDCSPYYPFGIGQMQALSLHPVDLQQSGLQPSFTHPQSLGLYHTGYGASGSVQNPMESPSRVFDCPSIQITSSPANCHQDLGVHQQEACPAGAEGNGGSALAKDQLYLSLEAPYRDTSSLSPCSPCSSLSSRSWFSDASSCESFSHVYDDVEAELNEAAARVRLVSPYVSPLGSPLPSPLASPQASPQVSPIVSPFGSPSYAQQATYGEDPWYRFQQQQQQQQHALFAQSLSPHQSPYQSPRTSVTEETWLNPRTHSSSSRPSSRPTSPCGKRRHSSAEVMLGSSSPHLSPIPTPTHSPQGSFTEESWMSNPTSIFAPFQPCALETDVPVKTRRTYQPYQNQSFTPLLPGQADLAQEDHGVGSAAAPLDTALEGSLAGIKKEDVVEHFLSVPTHFSWTKPKQVHNPIYRASALPSLDCLLPSQFGQCELHIEVQPKPHHRAHYETEGSRGAIKSPSGGHPMVKLIGYNEKPVNLQLFIGTADERHVRPHAFYQVHRITGKTVTTASQEMIIASTKVLEIPLLPENNMSASIDCAGILKLRNSDIELRKGETDIGRKNTRVRIVFRVHIPQANGNVLSLQTASVPIECSQRSALELPQIQKFSPVSSTVNGGEEMLITGPNINSESKVIFLEKSPDGRTQWEIDAKPVHEKCKDMSIVVKIPPYHKRVITAPAQVYFYVSNGKRKRSPAQRFTYLSVQIKQEFGQEKDLTSRDPLDSQSTHSLHGHYAAEFQSLSDQNLPLEQWLFDGGPGFGASSAQLSYSPVSSSPLNQPVLPGRDFNAGPALYHTLNPRAVESIKPSYLDSQPKSHHNGGPSLPVNSASLQNPKSMSFPSGEAVSRPDVSYNGSPVVLSGSFSSSSGGLQINRESVHKHSRDFQVPPGSGSEHQLQSHQDLHGTRHKPSTAAPFLPVDPGKFPQPSSSAQVPPLSHQSPARESPSASSPAGGGLVDLQLTRSPPVQAAGTSIASLSPETSLDQSLEAKKLDIKQEPDEDKELAFQSIGLQDITLDDVSEIIVRDLFQSPDPHDSAEGQSKP